MTATVSTYRDRVRISELDTNEPWRNTVDFVIYDPFAQPEYDHDRSPS